MKYFRALVSSPLCAFAILTLFFTASVAAQTDSQGAGAGTDLRFHKFQPSVAPENALPAAALQANPDTITQQQILSLEQDKASRTPDSRRSTPMSSIRSGCSPGSRPLPAFQP